MDKKQTKDGAIRHSVPFSLKLDLQGGTLMNWDRLYSKSFVALTQVKLKYLQIEVCLYS